MNRSKSITFWICKVFASAILVMVLAGEAPRSSAETVTRTATRGKTNLSDNVESGENKDRDDNPASSGLDKYHRLYVKGNYAAAQKGYDKLLCGDQTRAGPAVGLSEVLAIRGEYKKALETLESVTEQAKDNPRWLVASAKMLHELGRYENCLACAEKANRILGEWAPAILIHGRVLETLGRKKKAIEVYRTMAESLESGEYKRDAQSLVALGKILNRHAVLTGRKASEQAANILHNYFQEAYQKVDEQYWPAHIAAGELLLEKHRPKQAAEEFKLATKINSQIPSAYVGMGIIQLRNWQFEKCLSMADKALKINPHSSDALLLKALCYMQWRKFKKVAPELNKVLKTNPNNLQALSLYAALQIRLGCEEEANKYSARVKEINPHCADLPATIGHWLAAARQFDRAEKYYKRAVELAPEKADPLTDLGLLYMQTGQEAEAKKVLEKAHNIDDYRADVVNYLRLLDRLEDYVIRETEHFIIKLDGDRDVVLLDSVAEILEEIYPQVCGDFSHEPEEKTIIEILPDHPSFSVRITGKGWIGTVGACTGRVIALTAPDKARSRFGSFNWPVVLRHEFTHTVTLSATGNRIPHWFTEACAVWEQPDRRNYDAVKLLVSATRSGQLLPVEKMDWSFIRPRRRGERSLAYAQAEWIFEYIVDKYDYDTIIKMLEGYRNGLNQQQVFDTILETDQADFDKSFAAWAKEQVQKWGFNADPLPNPSQTAKNIKKDPANSAAHAAHAVALYIRGKRKEARLAAEKALKLDEQSTDALAVMAKVLLGEKKYDEAAEYARRLNKLDLSSTAAPRVLSKCHMAERKWAKAIESLEKLKMRRPVEPYAYEELAKLYMQLGRPEKALPNLIELHRRTMRETKYARQVAEAARSAGKYEQAAKYFREITHIDPYDAGAYRAMASLYVQLERYEEARRAAENLCLLSKSSPTAHFTLAAVLYRAGLHWNKKDLLLKAREAAQKALELAPGGRSKILLEQINRAIEKIEPSETEIPG